MAINFQQVGSFNGVSNDGQLKNPTSLEFGPDGRLYVAEQNGTINAYSVELQDGSYVATANEQLTLPGGGGVVKSIQNHNDDGSLSTETKRQVTGLVVAGTAANPVLYISSSDPRIAVNGDINLDTNSGVVTRATWTGSAWDVVDIVRGLPRSEENHSINGMVLSPDGNTLYLTVGGNTNNGAPSKFFSYTGEYALSGTVLEIDLADIESRPILTDTAGGQNGARKYVYDLPTLDDPSVPNDGVREDSNGLDVAGPWGGNDGFNMAILPADAPMRIYADGFRNQYDLVLTQAGKLYTVDNGSNKNLGGNPLLNGSGEATNAPNNLGSGDPEPLFLIEDGGYYGHPAPARSNQDLAWTVYDDSGNPDAGISPNTAAKLSDLVPDAIAIADGFIIDPSKFTGDTTRLNQSGIRIERSSSESNALATLGSSSNGLVEYTGNAFDGALKGALLVTQFNGSVTLLNLNDAGTGLEPLVGPGNDEILGTADDVVIDNDGIYPLISSQSLPLDVTTGPDGTIWVAEFGPDNIEVFAPVGGPPPEDDDQDGDGLLNAVDPFIRDATNGTSVTVSPGQTLLWDFDANQDGNLPGPDGFGGGLTGVMIDGSTDFEQFFQAEATLPGQLVKLDNLKFATAAGGGTTVVEFVSNGDPLADENSGEYLFHTGATIAPTVDTFAIKWSVFNPAADFAGSFQQIGGYIGTGDQSNYLKLVAIQSPAGEIQVLLEDNDVVIAESYIQADDLFAVPDNQKIIFELEVDPTAATATPTISYETGNGGTTTVAGTALNLSGTAVLDAIQGNHTVDGQATGLAVGLLSSNRGQSPANAFQAVFDDIEITATGDPPPPPAATTVLYRVNAGGAAIAATDESIPWAADTKTDNNPYLSAPGSNDTSAFPAVNPGASVPATTPGTIFDSERWDRLGGEAMTWAFDVPVSGLYEVHLYMGEGFNGASAPGARLFDVAIEGSVPANLKDIDLSAQLGPQVGGVMSNTVEVTDGTLNLEFLHGSVENPLINGIEILQVSDAPPPPASTGAALLGITANSNNIQLSNFGSNSFQVTNTGDKKIAQIDIDVTNALYPDSVFDPFGLAGDSAKKGLKIDTNGGTGAIAPSDASYIGVGGTSGFEGLQIAFDPSVDGGFQPGETLGFSVDMDPNSIAGTAKGPLDAGTSPAWDVGGVSGAELIGSTFTVTFEDGTTATGQLQGTNTQAGSQALASQASPNLPVTLTANGFGAGSLGTYDAGGPSVIVNGPAGQTARIVLTKGFIQPVTPYAQFLQDQLDVLAAADFPANNAVEFQTVDVVLTGADQDISELFNFSEVAKYDLPGEGELPLGFVASVVDPANGFVPLGAVTQPIYLEFTEQDAAETEVSLDESSNLAIVDVNGGTSDDTLLLTQEGANLRVSDPDRAVVAGTGVTQVTPNIAEIPLLSIAGSTTVRTLAGNDSVVATTLNKAVTAFGGKGSDTLQGGLGGDRLLGEVGDDILYGRKGDDSLAGGIGDDLLEGQRGDDTVYGNDGNDRIGGYFGRDLLKGGSGRDSLWGGPQADTLSGNDGHDLLVANEGDDQLFGDQGYDFLSGGRGNDLLEGGEGDDRLFGDRDNDTLHGQQGNDSLEGGDGNDLLEGQLGHDTLFGGGGNDRIGGYLGRDLLKGGSGRDSLWGGAHNDTLFGDGGDDLLVANEGDDQLFGGAGNDFLRGGAGNDFLRGGAGNDTLVGTDNGRGTIDILRGLLDSDRYVLGRGDTVFYDDDTADTVGVADYARIQSFNTAEDVIQLPGVATDYVLGASPIAGANGTAIFIDKPGTDELIAVVEGVSGLDLNASYFAYL